MHRVVLGDTGVPSLHKRGYKMPGYREVIRNGNMDDEHLESGQNSAFLKRSSIKHSSKQVLLAAPPTSHK